MLRIFDPYGVANGIPLIDKVCPIPPLGYEDLAKKVTCVRNEKEDVFRPYRAKHFVYDRVLSVFDPYGVANEILLIYKVCPIPTLGYEDPGKKVTCIRNKKEDVFNLYRAKHFVYDRVLSVFDPYGVANEILPIYKIYPITP